MMLTKMEGLQSLKKNSLQIWSKKLSSQQLKLSSGKKDFSNLSLGKL
jgi:hypothetical protein